LRGSGNRNAFPPSGAQNDYRNGDYLAGGRSGLVLVDTPAVLCSSSFPADVNVRSCAGRKAHARFESRRHGGCVVRRQAALFLKHSVAVVFLKPGLETCEGFFPLRLLSLS
jgi:hypothetical protein